VPVLGRLLLHRVPAASVFNLHGERTRHVGDSFSQGGKGFYVLARQSSKTLEFFD
jgi:hypothetical protein